MSGYGVHALNILQDERLFISLAPQLPEDGSDQQWPRPTYLPMLGEHQWGDTLFIPERYVERCPARSNVRFRSGWFEDLRYYYVPKVQWALLPSGALVVGCPASPLVDIINPDGRVTRIVFPWPREKVSREEIAGAKAMFAWYQAFRKMDPGATELPATRSSFVAILTSEDSRVWIWRAPGTRKVDSDKRVPGLPAHLWSQVGGGIFDVFEADGAYLGSVEQPDDVVYAGHPGTFPPVIRGDTVWAVVKDRDEVETIARFVVTPSLAHPPQ